MIDEHTKDIGRPAYYMINCSHPDHFIHIYDDINNQTDGTIDSKNIENNILRIKSIKPNASRKKHKELDGCSTLDDGDPDELGRQVAEIRKKSNNHVNIISGCCGTDLRHLRKMIEHVLKVDQMN